LGRRIAHCHPGAGYEFIFPIDESSELVGYEIDKRRGCFVNVGFQTGERDEHIQSSGKEEGELTALFRSMNISATEPRLGPVMNLDKDSTETKTITLPDGDILEQKMILNVLSDCVLGDLDAVSEYLTTSTEANLFLHGKDENGNTALIMAAAEWNHEMVSLLLQHGADANSVNYKGRSPLMEAALWGRIESVKVLLEVNVNKRLRDHDDRCALDLAQPARKNEKERYERSSYAAAQSVPDRDRDRRHIVILLGDSNLKKRHEYTRPLSKSERSKYCFGKYPSEMSITLCGPIRSYRVLRTTKTAAILHRGDQYNRISATSGWSADALPLNNPTGPHWVEEVYHIASTIGHTFQDAPDLRWDQGKPGKFFASHAEKKLIVYFIDRHVFMPQDREPDQELEDSILDVEGSLAQGEHSFVTWAKVCDLEKRKVKLNFQLSDAEDPDSYDEQEVTRLKHEIRVVDEELSSLKSDTHVATMRAQEKRLLTLLKRKSLHEDLMKLSENEPPVSLKEAVILSSNQICDDCDTFKRRVNDWFQLNIELSWCPK
jgi:hypothetical protein